jgi:hypothetical protein
MKLHVLFRASADRTESALRRAGFEFDPVAASRRL